ncbi:DIP1984 family protein [Lichenicoccus sp.]|uniref:DIP1984 family protein n=1 Tax=Lichenicoccus sp. TaxID=2781899 RepID=UPI003D1136F7
MKLAEALVLRADLSKRLEQLKARLQRNAKVQEGDQPAEAPGDLISEYESVVARFGQLVAQINLTNAATAFDGSTLTEALAQRDTLKLRQALYRDLAQSATMTETARTRSEVRFRATLPVAATQKHADDLSKELRTLDMRIQKENWQIDLKP